MAQPKKRLPEAHMRFYAAEVLLALQYLHLLGFVYRCVRALQIYACWARGCRGCLLPE